jgi:hypothetical protein
LQQKKKTITTTKIIKDMINKMIDRNHVQIGDYFIVPKKGLVKIIQDVTPTHDKDFVTYKVWVKDTDTFENVLMDELSPICVLDLFFNEFKIDRINRGVYYQARSGIILISSKDGKIHTMTNKEGVTITIEDGINYVHILQNALRFLGDNKI